MQHRIMQHLLTVDVESTFRAMEPGRSAGAHDPLLPAAMDAFLDLLESVNAQATFFVLGSDVPQLTGFLSRCATAGHEIACHGMRHVRVESLSPDEFRNDIRDAIAAIEDSVQIRCQGYRAPWFSAPFTRDWFFETLRETGIRYDASLRLPVETRLAGESKQGILLMPTPTLKFGAARVGAIGGLTLRIFPRILLARMIRRCENYRQPACLYLHPYEWYPGASGMSSEDIHRRPPADGRKRPGRALSTLRRTLLTERTLPTLNWLAQRTALTSVEQWLQHATPSERTI